jgi:aminopeptidase N
MALVAGFHLTVSHVTAYLDFAQYKERTIHVRLALDVVCNCETTDPLLLNGINFVNVLVEGATRFSYDGFFVRAWLDGWRAGQHHRVFVSYDVVRPVCGVTFVEHADGHVSIGCDFEACSARYMFACQDAPSFSATWEMHIRAPAALTRLATGQIVSEVEIS